LQSQNHWISSCCSIRSSWCKNYAILLH